jgi:Bacterial Ig-like domain (group 3)/FG-GAP-like repeat
MSAHLFPALLLTMIALPSISFGQNGTGTAATTVAATPTSVTVGGTVGLTASVQANSVSAGKAVTKPTGSITFLDGSTPLNTAPISLAPGGYSSATFPQTFGTPNTALTQQEVSSLAIGELTGDLNGDGIPDLLVYHYEPPYSVQTFISNGKGGYTAGAVQTFNFPITAFYPNVTNVPQLIDVNGDGKLDLLCGLLVAYGNGDGTFAAAVPVSFLSSGFVTSYAADLNGDGKTDILAVDSFPNIPLNDGPVQFALTVFLNQGAGSFTSAGTFPVTAQLTNNAGFAALNFFPPVFVDLNGDGKLDLITQTQAIAATNIGGDAVVDALLNNGDGTFGSFIPASVPDPPHNTGGTTAYGAASGDVNGDGKQDLVLTLADGVGNLDAIILLGNGDGGFQSPLYLTLATGPAYSPLYQETPAVVVQDFNLDGKQDLIFGDGHLALGNGDGTFTLSSPLFPAQVMGDTTTFGAFPLVPITLSGNLVPSLVFFLPAVTPPTASVFTPLTSSSATLSVTSLGAGAHTITAQYSGDADYATDTSAGVAVTVSQATSTTAVTSSANPSFAGQSVTLTASVASSGPTPTGNIIFTSGSTTLGTVALSGGSAAYTTTSLTSAGTQTITATYSGDANTQASSATINQVINAAFTPAPASGGGATLTVKSGQTVITPISVTGATGFSGQVALACSGLPAGAACSFTPATVAVSGTKPATSSLTVNTGASAAAAALAVQEIGTGVHRVAYGFTFGSFLFLGVIRRRGRNTWALFGCLLLLCSLGLTACGGNSTPSGTAPGTYNFTVTATSGSLKASSNLTLNVQ